MWPPKAATLPYSKIVISILSPCSAWVSAIFSLLLFWLCSHAHNCALSKWLQIEFNLGKQDRKVVQLVSEHCVDVERKMSPLLFLVLQGLRSFIWDCFPQHAPKCSYSYPSQCVVVRPHYVPSVYPYSVPHAEPASRYSPSLVFPPGGTGSAWLSFMPHNEKAEVSVGSLTLRN